MAESYKEQLDEDLASTQKILETYRRNRRHLTERQAELGGKLDLELRNNIDWHDEQIQIYEAEIARLKTEAAVENESAT
jgi:predicted amino acid dehydrogenase